MEQVDRKYGGHNGATVLDVIRLNFKEALMMKVDRRSFLKVIGGVTLMGVLAGCGGDASGGGNNDPGNSGGAGSDVGGGTTMPDDNNTSGGDDSGEVPDDENKKTAGEYYCRDERGILWKYYYDGVSSEVTLTGYEPGGGVDPVGALTLPSSLDGFKITKIGDYAFRPQGKNAFRYVTELTIPASITEVGMYGLAAWNDNDSKNRELKKVTVQGNSLVLHQAAFQWQSRLEEIVGWEKLSCAAKDGVGIFTGTGFKAVSVPKQLMGVLNFNVCRKLELITIEGDNEQVSKRLFGSCRYLKEAKILPGAKVICEGVFDRCTQMERIYIPSTVKKIEKTVFHNTKDAIPLANLKIYYGGTPQMWQQIEIDSEDNERLADATFIYNAKVTDMK